MEDNVIESDKLFLFWKRRKETPPQNGVSGVSLTACKR